MNADTNELLIAEEYRSPYWKYGFFTLLALSLLLYGLFWYQGDPVWGNSLRLASFICFAGAVFLGMRLREGTYTLRLTRTENDVSITYFKKERELDTEQLDAGRLHSVESAEAEQTVNLLPGADLVYVLGRYMDDPENRNHLFHFGGRTLKFDRTTAGRIIDFLSPATGNGGTPL